MSRCTSDAELRALLDGADDAAAEAHLGECEVCRAQLEALAGAGERFVAPPERERTDSEALERVIAGLKEAPLGEAVPTPRRRWIWVLAVLALLLAGFGLSRLLPPAAPRPGPPAETPVPAFTNPRTGAHYDDLAAAIASARDGDTIEVCRAWVELAGGLDLNRTLTLRAGDGHRPVLKLGAPLTHRAALTLEGLTLQGDTAVRSHARLAACHCFFQRPDGSTADTPLVVAGAGARLSLLNSALLAKRGAGIAFAAPPDAEIVNTLLATEIGIALAPSGQSEAAGLRLDRVSFHGTLLFAGGRPTAPYPIEVTRTAIDADTPSRTTWQGRDNLYPLGDPIPPGEPGAASCPMDFRKRIRRHVRGGGDPAGQDLRPSAAAARTYPNRGFDPDRAGLGESYQAFRQSEAYREWRASH